MPQSHHEPPQPFEYVEDKAEEHEPIVIIGTPPRVHDEGRAHVVRDPQEDLAYRRGATPGQQAQEAEEPEELARERTPGAFAGVPLPAENLRVGGRDPTEISPDAIGPRVVGHRDEQSEGVCQKRSSVEDWELPTAELAPCPAA